MPVSTGHPATHGSLRPIIHIATIQFLAINQSVNQFFANYQSNNQSISFIQMQSINQFQTSVDPIPRSAADPPLPKGAMPALHRLGTE
jgi:hypothetical protein